MATELLSPRSRSHGILFSIPHEMRIEIKIRGETKPVFYPCSSLQERNSLLQQLFEKKVKLQGTYILFLSDKYPTLLLGKAKGEGKSVEEESTKAILLACQLDLFFQSCSFTENGMARRSGPNVLFSVKSSEDKKRVVQEMRQRLECCTLEEDQKATEENAAAPIATVAISDMISNCTIM